MWKQDSLTKRIWNAETNWSLSGIWGLGRQAAHLRIRRTYTHSFRGPQATGDLDFVTFWRVYDVNYTSSWRCCQHSQLCVCYTLMTLWLCPGVLYALQATIETSKIRQLFPFCVLTLCCGQWVFVSLCVSFRVQTYFPLKFFHLFVHSQ